MPYTIYLITSEKTGGAFALIPFPSHTVSWPVYTVPTEKGNGCNCDSAQRSRKKKTFGVNADDLKKKKLLNKKVKLLRF